MQSPYHPIPLKELPLAIALSDLIHWQPKLEKAGIPTPETIIVTDPDDSIAKLVYGLNAPTFSKVVEGMKSAGRMIGYPFFMRTGQTSAKFMWDKSCFVKTPDKIAENLIAMVEYLLLERLAVDFPNSTIVARKYIQRPTLARSNIGMPICPEWRHFSHKGEITSYPYWPLGAVLHLDPKTVDQRRSLTCREAYEVHRKLCGSEFVPPDELLVATAEALGTKETDPDWCFDTIVGIDGKHYVIDCCVAPMAYRYSPEMEVPHSDDSWMKISENKESNP